MAEEEHSDEEVEVEATVEGEAEDEAEDEAEGEAAPTAEDMVEPVRPAHHRAEAQALFSQRRLDRRRQASPRADGGWSERRTARSRRVP